MTSPSTQRRAILVSDFDGTLARPDFYHLTREHLVPRDTPDYWIAYRNAEMTHFDALNAFFAAAEGGEAALRQMTDMMTIPPNLAELLRRLDHAGWDVAIVSAGCTWYIDLLLQRAGVELPVYANPGRIENGRLVMQRPADPNISCLATGIDKTAVVRSFAQEGRTVAFAGDGFPDFDAASLVEPERRFARRDLVTACRKNNVPFRPFDEWPEVAEALISNPIY